MGGPGSGRRGTRKTVEECLVLSANTLTGLGLLGPDLHKKVSLCWRQVASGEITSSMGCEADTRNDSHWSFRITYRITESQEIVDYTAGLTSTKTPWESLRWWFICRQPSGGDGCERRVGKLYLPPGERYFACRHCHDLTYFRCNHPRKPDIFTQFLTSMGCTPRKLGESCRGEKIELIRYTTAADSTGTAVARRSERQAKHAASCETITRPSPKSTQCRSMEVLLRHGTLFLHTAK